jgi:hypothetical protein
MRRLVVILSLAALLGLPSFAQATPIGILSFDLLGGGANTFNVTNFTGSFGLPPLFPSLTDVFFTNTTLQVEDEQGTVSNFDLGTIGPGSFMDLSGLLVFPDFVRFTRAQLSATLAQTALTLANGSTFQASPLIVATLLPSSGTFLEAGVDFVTIHAQAVPEPSTLLLTTSAGLAFGACRRRRRRL